MEGLLMSTHLDAKGRTIFMLDETLDLTHASQLAQSFLGMKDKDIIVDASNVKHLGAQCGQVLLSAKRFWSDAGKSLKLVNPSAEFNESMRLLGLKSHIPVEESAQ
jgi:chemotaxis protein CheX